MKTGLLIIDGKKKIEGAVSSSLNSIEKHYFLFFAENFEKALAEVENNEIEIVLCDLDFENKNEISVLQEIRKNFPHVFIIVCTTENKLQVNEIYKIAHQVISEPITEAKLADGFRRKEKMSKYLHDGKLMGIINNVSDLPGLPDTYIKIEQEIASDSISMQKIGKFISDSVTFTAKILRVVNSPFFGLEFRVSNTMQAVNLLGVNVLKSLLLYDHIFTKISINPLYKKYFEDLWLHSNKVGRFAEQIIYLTRGSEIEMMEEAYIAGLMHDIGKVVMLSLDEYPDQVFNYMKEHNIKFSSAENKIYGTSHAEIGAYFLTLWGFPETSAETVSVHNNPSKIDFKDFTVQSAMYIANAMAYDEEMDLEKMRLLNLGVKPDSWLNYLEDNDLLKSKI